MENLINKVLHGDCLELMKDIPDKSIDMVLCDLPYQTTRNHWDVIIPLEPLWEQYERIIKDNGAIVLFGQTPFDKVLGASNLKLLRYEWIWEKNVATGHLNSKRMPMKKHENILVFYKKQPNYNPQMEIGKPYKNKRKAINDSGSNYAYIERKDTINKGERFPNSILKFDREINLHPTQKPVPLLEYLIKTYTNEGELILDNCIGSGTTAIAAINTKRNFIGIEKEIEYVNIANQRINDFYTKKA